MTTLREAAEQALKALELALSAHGTLLLSDPPQDPWKTKGVEIKSRHAITVLRAALAEPNEISGLGGRVIPHAWDARRDAVVWSSTTREALNEVHKSDHEEAHIAAAVAAAVAAEREACAKACDEYSADRWAAYKGQLPYKPMPPARKRFIQGQCVGADDCAAVIRARSKP